ncbi:BZIP transcription factor [Penicillium ucsense]|uniref:BZIP transcription factor n=1 Tax=Penicillium ucsense TaxID=2839758 RepID=A0A8J8W1I7_9EURO|nr:BZIP transcription factor [Penicillium ucsense]KAF7739282.1 BZIP transcription factor [Penicillium ucsense]
MSTSLIMHQTGGKYAAATVPRKRGRPRTLTDDQQIPERRRKQLRVAQQAYRKRKETTINNLQSRVHELESGIEALGKSFLSFSNLLLDAQVIHENPQVAAALQEITKQCVSLAQVDQDAPDSEASVVRSDTTSTSPSREPRENLQIISTGSGSHVSQSDISTFNTIYQPSEVHQELSPFQNLPLTPPYPPQTFLPFGLVLTSPNITHQMPHFVSDSYPTSVAGGAILEGAPWTLAQRLVRRCCQNAYRLLTHAAGNEPLVQAIFGKPLTNFERNTLISEFFAATQDQFGDIVEFKSRVFSVDHRWRNDCPPGLEATSSGMWQKVQEKGIDEWIDANEIQRFLQERGVRIQDISHSASTMPPHGGQYHYAPQLNISSFVDLLCHLGANCLGRGPIFQRSNVERALQMTISELPWGADTGGSLGGLSHFTVFAAHVHRRAMNTNRHNVTAPEKAWFY